MGECTRWLAFYVGAAVLGLLQFVTTFGLAWYYSKFSPSRLDPLARDLEQSYRDQAGTDAKRGQA